MRGRPWQQRTLWTGSCCCYLQARKTSLLLEWSSSVAVSELNPSNFSLFKYMVKRAHIESLFSSFVLVIWHQAKEIERTNEIVLSGCPYQFQVFS